MWVKYSGKRIKDTTQFEKYTDKLFIETRSEEGLRFRLQGTWHAVAAPELPGEFMDEEGAGDWTSATFIHLLTAHGVRHIADLSTDDCAALLAQAQKKGAENCCCGGSPRTDENHKKARRKNKTTMDKKKYSITDHLNYLMSLICLMLWRAMAR